MLTFKARILIRGMLSKLIPDNLKLRYLIYLPKVETWKRNHKESYPLFKDRLDLYDFLSTKILHNVPITYLEFGVFRGKTIKYWSSINKHSDSMFFGFDTFSGLPEDWINFSRSSGVYKGSFNAEGEVPEIKDCRVAFIKGLFQEVLPEFLEKQQIRSNLVIHMDADLYSSTLYALTRCNDIILPGTIIIFDEFSSILHEFRALEDYCSSYLRNYVVLGATENFMQIAIQIKNNF